MSDDDVILIESSDRIEITDPPVQIIEIATPGPQGTPGAPGPSGGEFGAFVHTQATAATVWTITHNMGYDPAGILVVSDGFVIDGCGVQYLATGVSLRLSFDIAFDGVAYLS